MPVDPDLVAMMLDVVTFYPPGTRNGYAEAPDGTAVAVTCRVESSNTMIRDSEGRERVTTATIYTDRIYGIQPSWRPVFADGTTHPVMRVDTWEDDEGPSHEVVYV